jgi:hypothetical protein
MIIDAWGQHPTLRHSRDPIFDSLRRWIKEAAPSEALPLEATLGATAKGGVDAMLISAWYAPRAGGESAARRFARPFPFVACVPRRARGAALARAR